MRVAFLLLFFGASGMNANSSKPERPKLRLQHPRWDVGSAVQTAPNFWQFKTSAADESLQVRRLGTMTRAEAGKQIQIQLERLLELTSQGRDPYTGHPAASQTCDPQRRPPLEQERREGNLRAVLHLFATAEGLFGSCMAEQDRQKSRLVFLYCGKNRELFEITYFYPASRGWDSSRVAECG